MLLTLATGSLARLIGLGGGGSGNGSVQPLDLPQYAITHLQLRGLNVPASLLSGWPLEQIDRLRDRADKAGCPCLVLVEDAPLAIGSGDEDEQDAAAERIRRLATAAHRLGCNAIGVCCVGEDNDETFDRTAEAVRSVMREVERMELNLLLAPHEGLTYEPDRLTELIKRIGGFRIGSLPSFGHAAETKDPIHTLRQLAPYAGAIHATVSDFTKAGKHKTYDLAEYVQAIRSVGFVNTLAIDYIGDGDAAESIDLARRALEAAIEEDV